MAYSGLALARSAGQWSGADLELADMPDLDAAGEALRDYAAEKADDGTALLFVEEDDEYVGIVRVDGDADPSVFISDRRVVETSDLAERLFAEALPVITEDEEDEDEGTRPVAVPAGDLRILASFGVSDDQLVELCGEEGALPADIIAALCERIGAGEQFEALRV
ncbi:MAG: hypothetical protein JWM48_887 [Mycobacterium sp.]|nr:hypothetical protein [Mycobacterium sp.]MCW2744337.1 hypothetical protein [Mycobacterium sp.]